MRVQGLATGFALLLSAVAGLSGCAVPHRAASTAPASAGASASDVEGLREKGRRLLGRARGR